MAGSISTKTGDDGTTALLFGRRVPKTHPRVEAYGTMDELSAVIGMARSDVPDTTLNENLELLQRALLTMGSSLAVDPQDRERYEKSKIAKPSAEMVDRLDAWVEELEKAGVTFEGFVMPGGTRLGASFDLARTVCRRAERAVQRVAESGEAVHPHVLPYLNRMSDLLWLLARQTER